MRAAKSPETGCVILFWPRQAGSRPATKAQRGGGVVGLRKPRLAPEDDGDHHRRRLVHALGLAYCLILVAAGVWLVNALNEMKHSQDGVLLGGSRSIATNAAAHSDQ
jgi:hypothetical protein